MSKTVVATGEFGLIRRIQDLLQKEGPCRQGVTLGIGDDAASFTPRQGYDLLVTCDCMVEGRHYLSDHITPMDLGRRAMASNISDIGAMGGLPLYALVSLGLKAETLVAEVEALYRGFVRELNPFGACVVGGNLTKSENNTFIDITLIGEVEKGKSVHRSTAKPGDVILVTGYPGQASAGLQLLLNSEPTEDLRDHLLVRAYNTPSHRAREGKAIAESGFATAMTDTSDGFLGDLGHICDSSSVGAEVIQGKLPVSEDLRKAASQLGRDLYDLVLQDSDDYELIVTCPPTHTDQIRTIVAALSDVAITEVGTITDATDGIKLMLPDGAEQEITPGGWDHFRGKEGKDVR